MQINTAMKCHLTPVWMAYFKKTEKNKCWWGCGEKSHTMFTVMQIGSVSMESNGDPYKKTLYKPAITPLSTT